MGIGIAERGLLALLCGVGGVGIGALGWVLFATTKRKNEK